MKKADGRSFTDRESGTFGGLMLSLREYYDRIEVHTGYELNKKPRKIDCLIIDKKDDTVFTDNDITRIFAKHNIIELKNPYETVNIHTIWKTISYAAQYMSERINDKPPFAKDVTVSIIRTAKPRKAMAQLQEMGYSVSNPLPGIYYISGMADFKTQIVVTSELKGDKYVPLRMQRKNAAKEDYRLFVDCMKTEYTDVDLEYIEAVLKYGIYDEKENVFTIIREDTKMRNPYYEIIKDDLAAAEDKGRKEGEKIGEKKGEAERKKLEERIKFLEEELKKTKIAML